MLSADTATLLRRMGYAVNEQTPWGAAELITHDPGGSSAAAPSAVTSGNDSTRGGQMRPGFVYGAKDNRRPAG